jgi:hypothetical protein
MFPGTLNVQTTLDGNTSITQGLFIEMMLTAQLGRFRSISFLRRLGSGQYR